MQRYIDQFIEDIREIAENMEVVLAEEDEPVTDDESFYRHIENVEKFLYSDPVPVEKITGIMPEQLPPPERLSNKQMAQLAVVLEEFLDNFHFSLAFPHNYPMNLRYPFIRDFWSEEHVWLQGGQNHIEFCNYIEEECPFPGYCTICEEIKNEPLSNMDKSNDEGELPF